MGAGSRGEGGGEEEGGGLWAPAPFIAAAGRARVPCFRSHGGANSCYQQAPGCLQHGRRRHHPVASDRRGGNAGKRRGRRPPRPESGARAWWGAAAAPAPSWPLRPVGAMRCWGRGGSRGSARAFPPGAALLRAWVSRPGRKARGGAGAAGPASPGGGLGEGPAGGLNWSPRGPGAACPAGRCLQGHLGDARGTRGHTGLVVGRPALPRLVLGRQGFFYSLSCLAQGLRSQFWNCGVGAAKAAAVWHLSVFLQCNPFRFRKRRSSYRKTKSNKQTNKQKTRPETTCIWV